MPRWRLPVKLPVRFGLRVVIGRKQSAQGVCSCHRQNFNKRLTTLFGGLIFPRRISDARGGAACPAWGVGSAVRTSRLLSVPRMRPNFTCRMFSTKLRVIVRNFAHQLFDQLLADHAVLAAGFQVAGYDAGGSAPRKVLRPPTLEASHLLTGPTGCPGFEFSGFAPDDPPPRTPLCHHLPRIKTF